MSGFCGKCGIGRDAAACTRLACPRQSDQQRAEVASRWRRAQSAFESLRLTGGVSTMVSDFARKGWKVTHKEMR